MTACIFNKLKVLFLSFLLLFFKFSYLRNSSRNRANKRHKCCSNGYQHKNRPDCQRQQNGYNKHHKRRQQQHKPGYLRFFICTWRIWYFYFSRRHFRQKSRLPAKYIFILHTITSHHRELNNFLWLPSG